MKSNIILTGMPGCGKTTLGEPLAKATGRQFLDFDDDIIEKQMGKTVADCLAQLGQDDFLKMEEKLVLDLNIDNTVLATSGSVVLSLIAMNSLRRNGISIYIDTPVDTIEARRDNMQTDRIASGGSFEEILTYRQSFYDNSFDYKFVNNSAGTKTEVQNSFLNWFHETVR